MNIPNEDHAIVEREKVVDYLLNVSHPDGFGKAEFFTSLGFKSENWELLADALHQLLRNSPITKSMTSIHGKKYIVEGALQSPSGKVATVRTIWIVDTQEDAPRLVTAYPKD